MRPGVSFPISELRIVEEKPTVKLGNTYAHEDFGLLCRAFTFHFLLQWFRTKSVGR